MSLFQFSSHMLHLFCLFGPICFLFSLIFFSSSLFSHAYASASSLFFILFYFLRSSSSQAATFIPSTHATKPICTSLLPLTKPTITNPRILSLIEPTIVNPIAYLLPLTEPTLLSLTEPKNPVLKPIFSSQNRRFKGGEGRIRVPFGSD